MSRPFRRKPRRPCVRENRYQKAESTNIYGPRTPWYPDGRMTSYPYPPLTMLAAMIGDPRWVPTFGHLCGALTGVSDSGGRPCRFSKVSG